MHATILNVYYLASQPGVLGASPGIRAGYLASVWVDVDGKCQKGRRDYDGPLMFVGNGQTQLVWWPPGSTMVLCQRLNAPDLHATWSLQTAYCSRNYSAASFCVSLCIASLCLSAKTRCVLVRKPFPMEEAHLANVYSWLIICRLGY